MVDSLLPGNPLWSSLLKIKSSHTLSGRRLASAILLLKAVWGLWFQKASQPAQVWLGDVLVKLFMSIKDVDVAQVIFIEGFLAGSALVDLFALLLAPVWIDKWLNRNCFFYHKFEFLNLIFIGWDFYRLGFWDWDFEILRFWDFGILGFWFFMIIGN